MPAISVFDIFKIGVGPSSSHTVGPMKAALAFAGGLAALPAPVARVAVRLYGSLAYTGKGHGTDAAILLGLSGKAPDTLDPDETGPLLGRIHAERRLTLPHGVTIDFAPERDVVFDLDDELPRHTNGMRFAACDAAGNVLVTEDWYSLGGGFVVRGDEPEPRAQEGEPPYPFTNAAALLGMADTAGLTIAELMLANESTWRSEAEVRERLALVWETMRACVRRGLVTDGVLPGRIGVVRRAPQLYRALQAGGRCDGLDTMDWVNAWAIAVNEENAAGGRVVTSPTNGAAGIIPAVLHYYRELVPGADDAGVERFLLTAGAIGILYKINASISGAEMGCQGEVGVACSMAAGGLAAALGGTNQQVENAAEIGMEHNLGLTCDPVGGLVQIPCIERNAMGAVKAINAARLALQGDGTHKVSLDQVIATMRQTGLDMSTIYKETSRGGLAVNVPEC
ncbi:MAG TPA: L-serine ammonia-lyase [Woeseiaceae bacterium]|nr:L-serine ammonia-lyase [Woeseiaceae bacterium]